MFPRIYAGGGERECGKEVFSFQRLKKPRLNTYDRWERTTTTFVCFRFTGPRTTISSLTGTADGKSSSIPGSIDVSMFPWKKCFALFKSLAWKSITMVIFVTNFLRFGLLFPLLIQLRVKKVDLPYSHEKGRRSHSHMFNLSYCNIVKLLITL